MDDEPRYRELITGWIREGVVPDFPAFTNESERKRRKRKRRFEDEAEEAEEMKRERRERETSEWLSLLLAILTTQTLWLPRPVVVPPPSYPDYPDLVAT